MTTKKTNMTHGRRALDAIINADKLHRQGDAKEGEGLALGIIAMGETWTAPLTAMVKRGDKVESVPFALSNWASKVKDMKPTDPTRSGFNTAILSQVFGADETLTPEQKNRVMSTIRVAYVLAAWLVKCGARFTGDKAIKLGKSKSGTGLRIPSSYLPEAMAKGTETTLVVGLRSFASDSHVTGKVAGRGKGKGANKGRNAPTAPDADKIRAESVPTALGKLSPKRAFVVAVKEGRKVLDTVAKEAAKAEPNLAFSGADISNLAAMIRTALALWATQATEAQAKHISEAQAILFKNR